MRRLSIFGFVLVALVALSATPALAQSGGTSGRQSLLVTGGAIGAGIALFLFIWILFGSNAGVERDLRGRLGALSGQDEDQGRLSRIPLLRRFVTGAEDIARDRGFINQIETALDQANMPLRPGEAIAGIVGLAAIAGLMDAQGEVAARARIDAERHVLPIGRRRDLRAAEVPARDHVASEGFERTDLFQFGEIVEAHAD